MCSSGLFYACMGVLAKSPEVERPPARSQTLRSTISFLSSAMALAGESPFGHALAQFMIVWQR